MLTVFLGVSTFVAGLWLLSRATRYAPISQVGKMFNYTAYVWWIYPIICFIVLSIAGGKAYLAGVLLLIILSGFTFAVAGSWLAGKLGASRLEFVLVGALFGMLASAYPVSLILH